MSDKSLKLFSSPTAKWWRFKVFANWNRTIFQWPMFSNFTNIRNLTWHECNTSDMSGTRVRHERPDCGTSENFDFDNDRSENIFPRLYISYMANERLQKGKQFHSINNFSEMPCSHAKMRLRSAPKMNFVMAKTISKSYTLDCNCNCPCTLPHSYT